MIDLLLDAMSAYRLTRLITNDVILDRPRAAIIRNAYAWRDGGIESGEVGAHPRYWQVKAAGDDEAPKLAELVICRWCVSVYISFGVIVARRYARGVWEPVARGLALSAAAALIGGLEVE